MGLVWVEAVVRNPDTGRHAAAKALVDTGVTMTVVPRRIAEGSRDVPTLSADEPACAATTPPRGSPDSEEPNPSKSLNTAPRSGPAPPTQNRRKAVETLAEATTNAVRSAAGEKALETIRQRGYLDRHTYIEALQQKFARELTRHI